MPDVLNFLIKAAALLQALVAGGIIKTNSGLVIANLLSDIQNVVKGVQTPSANLVTQVAALLNDLKVSGLLQGHFIDELDAELVQFGTFAKAIQSTPGQPGIGPKEKLLGVEGSWVFIPDSAEAAVKDPLGL